MNEKKESVGSMHNVFNAEGKKIGTIFAADEETGLTLAKQRNPEAARVGGFSHAIPKVEGVKQRKGADDADASKDDKETKPVESKKKS